MRKVAKFFSAMIAVLFSSAFFIPFVEATWPPEDCTLVAPRYTEDILRDKYDDAIKKGKPAATYCFYYPGLADCCVRATCETMQFQLGDFNAWINKTPLDCVTVAICLQNDAAKNIFCKYFHLRRNLTDSTEVDDTISTCVIDARENVFVISFHDLNVLSKDIALYTEYGILGNPRLENEYWCWRNVIFKSWLCAQCDVPLSDYDCSRKARLLVSGTYYKTRELEQGSTVRVGYLNFDDEVKMFNEGHWTGKNVFIEPKQ